MACSKQLGTYLGESYIMFEDILHMFWECPTASELWRQLLLWLETELSIAIAKDASKILLYHELGCDVVYWDIISLACTICKTPYTQTRMRSIR